MKATYLLHQRLPRTPGSPFQGSVSLLQGLSCPTGRPHHSSQTSWSSGTGGEEEDGSVTSRNPSSPSFIQAQHHCPCSHHLSPAGPHPTQKTGITLTTSRMMGMVMMMRPHTTTMATPYSGKPGAGGGSRVSSGGGTELLALLIWVCCSHTPKGSSLTSYGNGVWIHLEV